MLHRTIDAVRTDMAEMGFNTAIARLFELNNHLTQVVQQRGSAPRAVVTPMVLMVAPLAPHIAEELWARLGHADTLAYESFPTADPALLVDDAVEVPVQVGGKVRSRITVPVGADDAAHEAARARRRPHRRTARRRHGAEGHRRARPPRQLRRLEHPSFAWFVRVPGLTLLATASVLRLGSAAFSCSRRMRNVRRGGEAPGCGEP